MTTIHGIVVDIIGRRFLPAELIIRDGIIVSIEEMDRICGPFLLPGLIDAHVHVESSMLVPSEFARAAMIHGTVGTVSDPHEIANVLGMGPDLNPPGHRLILIRLIRFSQIQTFFICRK